MPEMHLKQRGFTYSTSRSFIKNEERNTNLKKLDKARFQHDMAYGSFKVLNRRTAADKVLHDKAFNIAKYPKYDRYQRRLASMAYKFFLMKKSLVEQLKNKLCLIKN